MCSFVIAGIRTQQPMSKTEKAISVNNNNNNNDEDDFYENDEDLSSEETDEELYDDMYSVPFLTVKRHITAKNSGNLPITVLSMSINGSPCEGYVCLMLTHVNSC